MPTRLVFLLAIHGPWSRVQAVVHCRISIVSASFEIGPVAVGAGRLFLIAGPCVIESETHARGVAEALQRITADLGVPYIFKASCDKANRTSVKSFRGPGLAEGTRILGRIAKDTGLPILTDVHEPSHCEVAAEAADVRMAASRKGETLDISTRGMYFIVEQDLQAGSELDITLTLPAEVTHGSEVYVKAAGRVVRVDPRSEARNMRLGVAAVVERYDIVRGEDSLSN